MKKFLQEVFTYFWIPLIMGIVSYVFFQLRDVVLGIVILIALSAVYTLIRLYLLHKKWWLLVILAVVVMAAGGYFFIRSPQAALYVNDVPVNGATVTVSGGTVSISPTPETNGRYTKGTKIILTAKPSSGFDFKSWDNTDDDSRNPTSITLKASTHVTVSFEARASLIINNQPVIGSLVTFTDGSVSINPPPGDDGKYTRGTVVTLTATAAPGFDFKNWTGTPNDTSNPIKITMDGNKQVNALFNDRFSLYINNQLVVGSNISFDQGMINASPAPGDDDKYANGTLVTLTAAPNAGYGWKAWSGTSSDGSNPTKVTITSDKHVTVTFELRFYLTLNGQAITGPSLATAHGTITISPAPGADGLYSNGATVVLTAIPAQGYRFGGWSGDVTGQITSITVLMTANKNISVAFIKTYTMNVSENPSNGGTVTPGSGTYDEDTNVVLTAKPATGYRFDHWSGDASGATNPLTVNMNAEKNIIANFVKVYTLTELINPDGAGTITPAAGGYDVSSNLTLTAAPAAGYRFDHWSGDVSGNSTSASILMDGDKTVTANFVKTYILSVSVSPTNGGSVTPSGGTYDTGTSVTLTATAATGFKFDHWSGDASGTTATITVNMSADKNIQAVFVPSP